MVTDHLFVSALVVYFPLLRFLNTNTYKFYIVFILSYNILYLFYIYIRLFLSKNNKYNNRKFTAKNFIYIYSFL